MQRLCAAILLLLLALPAGAAAAGTSGFDRWKTQFAVKLKRKGFDRPAVNLFLANAYYVGKPIAAQKRQPEKISRFDDYRRLVLTPARVADGQAYLRDYQQFYTELGGRYGIEPQLLVALWGIESSYGKIMGKHPIIPSLASLAYAGRRREFFEQQLIAAVRIADRGDMPVERMTGSWAGAMGHYQFIPTTFERFAVDGDDDARRDLCGSYADAAASAGNYLQKLGWQPGDARIVTVDAQKGMVLLSREGKKGLYRPAAHWRMVGLLSADYPDQAAPLKLVGADDGRSGCYLVGEGFDRLKEWNRSTYFALAVLLLADQLTEPVVSAAIPPR